MDPIETIAPAGSWAREDSAATSRTVYFDAVETQTFHFENQTPNAVLEQQLSVLEENDEKVNSTFVYGVKPAWGWDYVLSFKIPGSMNVGDTANGSDIHRLRKRKRNSQEESNHSSILSAGNNSEPTDPDALTKRTAKASQKCEERTKKRVEVLARLKSAGFVFSQLFIPSEGVILVRIALPEKRMKAKAIKLGMELRLKEEFGGGYLTFSFEREEAFLNHREEQARNCYFCPADRAIIILNVLQSKEDWGCGLNIERLLYEKHLLQAFAIHSELEQRALITDTVWKRIWDPTYLPPFNALKDYLGGEFLYCLNLALS